MRYYIYILFGDSARTDDSNILGMFPSYIDAHNFVKEHFPNIDYSIIDFDITEIISTQINKRKD